MTLEQGIILRAVSGIYIVHVSGEEIQCSLRGNLKKEFNYSTTSAHARRVTRAKLSAHNDAIAVGDLVRISRGQDEKGVIEEILPRTNHFTRSGFRGREQTIIANIDQLVIVFACAEPRPDLWKLDRFLAVAEAEGLNPLIVANKSDLATADEIATDFGLYSRLGYTVRVTCAQAGTGIESLRDDLSNRVSAFLGPSGVGKSSLLNAVQPGLKLRTSEIGLVTFKGKHTTTAAELLPLVAGGWVADTPGLRQLELLQMERDELVLCFREFANMEGQCRFDNCRHDREPGCAIKSGVESGEIDERRYQSFLVIANELDAGKSRR